MTLIKLNYNKPGGHCDHGKENCFIVNDIHYSWL